MQERLQKRIALKCITGLNGYTHLCLLLNRECLANAVFHWQFNCIFFLFPVALNLYAEFTAELVNTFPKTGFW